MLYRSFLSNWCFKMYSLVVLLNFRFQTALDIQFPNTSTVPVMPYKNKIGRCHSNETILTKVSCHTSMAR